MLDIDDTKDRVHGGREYQEFRAGLGMIGAKEPDNAATQGASYS